MALDKCDRQVGTIPGPAHPAADPERLSRSHTRSVHATVLLATALLLQQSPGWHDGPPLPRPVANNAGVAVATPDGGAVLSFLGIDASLRWDGVESVAYRWTVGDDAWVELPSVPGPGRLAATAQAVGDRVYLFGGYTVAEDGSERSLPNVDVYDPASGIWSRGADIPVPVDDAVSGVWRDSLVFLVSGWHDTGNVDRVQIYDPANDRWLQATPIPGTPVFGHTGGIAGNAIVYVGGARVTRGEPRYAIEPTAWRGDIDVSDPTRIRWRRIEPPPGPPLYRAAGGSVAGRVIVAGGTDNPYNYDGVGYDGVPSAPRTGVYAYDVTAASWTELPGLAVATMDHRSIAVAGGRAVIAGGMTRDQTVTDRVTWIETAHLFAPPEGDRP